MSEHYEAADMEPNKTIRIGKLDSLNLDIEDNERILIDGIGEDGIYITIDPE